MPYQDDHRELRPGGSFQALQDERGAEALTLILGEDPHGAENKHFAHWVQMRAAEGDVSDNRVAEQRHEAERGHLGPRRT